MKGSCVDVIVLIPLDRLFTYKTDIKTRIGSVVNIPFGNNNEVIKGIVISKKYRSKLKFPYKKIISIESYNGILSDKQIKLLLWASEYYLVSLPKLFNSIFSKNILNLKIKEFIEIPTVNQKLNANINLVVDHSRDIIKNIFKDINPPQNQNLILSPNVFQTQFSYRTLSKKIKNIYIYDAKTSTKEKLAIWEKILMNEEIVVIGSKAAVFLPFQNLSKIFVMYEHNFLYKETERVLRYNSRDCAIFLSRLHKCDINLISDSPSIESMYNTKKKKFKFYDKSKKLKLSTDLDKITIYNKLEKKIKKELDGIISNEILEKIIRNFNEKNKTIIFTPYSDDVDIIKNNLDGLNKKLKIFSLSKHNNISRNQLDEFYDQINHYDLIIGNYSVIDSLESFKYNLLILIDPDKISSVANYKSNEIYFQLIFKVIKKVNYDKDKKLIIQLMNSNSEKLRDNIRNDYYHIISKEMEERKIFGYSPYKRLISLEVNSNNKENFENKGKNLYKELSKKLNFCVSTDVGLVNRNNSYIYKIYLKLDRVKNLSKNKKVIFEEIKKINKRKEFYNNLITIDVDP